MKEVSFSENKRCKFHKNLDTCPKAITEWIGNCTKKIKKDKKYSKEEKYSFILNSTTYIIHPADTKLNSKIVDVLIDKMLEFKRGYTQNSLLTKQNEYLYFLLNKLKEYTKERFEEWRELRDIFYTANGKELLKNLFGFSYLLTLHP